MAPPFTRPRRRTPTKSQGHHGPEAGDTVNRFRTTKLRPKARAILALSLARPVAAVTLPLTGPPFHRLNRENFAKSKVKVTDWFNGDAAEQVATIPEDRKTIAAGVTGKPLPMWADADSIPEGRHLPCGYEESEELPPTIGVYGLQ